MSEGGGMLDGLRIEGRENGRGGSIRQQTSLLTAVFVTRRNDPCERRLFPLSSWPKFLRLQWRRTFQNRHTFSYSGYDLLEGVGSLRVGGEANFNLSRM